MAISRRNLGLGLLALGIGGTGAYVAVRDNPEWQGLLGNRSRIFGFVGGEKQPFLADPDVQRLLGRHGLEVDSRIAGSVEMVREPALLSQAPQFLWPSSSVMVDLARQNGVRIRRDQVILNSPMVVYSWEPIVAGLVAHGLAAKAAQGHYELDLKPFLEAILAGADWSSLGVDALYGRARIVSTDPNRSNSGFMFSGLVLNVLSGTTAGMAELDRFGESARTIFRLMGLKSPSSGKLFDQYLAGGMGAEPMIVGYENQLVEWVLADPAMWQRILGGQRAKPAVLYPKPTVYSAHPLIAIDPLAERLIEALMTPELQQLAWSRHGFRGPLGAAGSGGESPLSTPLPADVNAVLPMPPADVMLALIARLAA